MYPTILNHYNIVCNEIVMNANEEEKCYELGYHISMKGSQPLP